MASTRSSEGPVVAAGVAPIQSEGTISKIPHILPHERVFPIQIGCELFKLSGASLSSDAPSYFSQYFLCQIRQAEERGEDMNNAIKTLYIDRDPETFRDISLHLQGYHVRPRDGTHFVRLFADAQFYSLPRLTSQLYDESIFISIGHREFHIPRDCFNGDPGNTPNYFSLGFAIFFSKPDDLFPGIDREGLIRPPSILPPSVPNRDADIFEELLRMLRGYPVKIRDETHRQQLLRDARYFHFKGLEQRLIAHSIAYNQARQRTEIALRLENVQKSGVTLSLDGDGDIPSGWVNYARPYVDNKPMELVLEIGGEATKVHLEANGGATRAEFFNETKSRITRLFEVLATKLNLPPTTQPLGLLMASGGASSQPASPGNTPLSEDQVRIIIDTNSAIILDGKELASEERSWLQAGTAVTGPDGNLAEKNGDASPAEGSHKRRRTETGAVPIIGRGAQEWIVTTGQWRLRVQPSKGGKSAVECALVAVKLNAISSELHRNASRSFLGS